MKRLGIIIVTYQSEGHIGPLLASLAATVDPAQTEVWIIDNKSPDGTIAAYERASAGLPLSLHFIRSEKNLGFMRANNVAYAAMTSETPCQSVALLNPDTVVHDGWWQPLLAELDKPGVGSASPLLLLPDGTINARGNAVHFLGLGFVQGYGEKPDAPTSGETKLFFGTGAALAFRPDTLSALNAKMGSAEIFWEELFLYADDTDLGWRMRLIGLEPRLVMSSRVTHDHRFWLKPLDGAGERMFWIERNRYLLLLANFKGATLLVLSPWIVASEMALMLGLWKLYPHRAKLWSAVWKETGTPAFKKHRHGIQSGRTAPDREILRAMTGSIRHGALPFRGVDRVLDAVLRFSHALLCAIVRW